MGSQSSSRGAGPEEEGRGEGQEEDDVDLRRVLSLLLRGRSVQDPSDEEEEEEEQWGWGNDDVTAPAPPPPDTRVLDGHELKAELLLARGKGAGPKEENLPRLLRMRQWGRCRNSSFSYGERSMLSSHFLPNHEAFKDQYPQKAFCGIYSPDGSLFVSASQDHLLRFYWSRDPLRLRPFRSAPARDVGWSLLDVTFTPDGTQCVYCSWSNYVHVYDIYGEGDNHTALDMRPDNSRFSIFSLAVGPDGREILGGGSDGCVYVYDRGVQRRTLRVEAHEDDVNAVALLDPGGQLLLSGGDDGVTRVWDRRSMGQEGARPVGLLAGHRDGVTFLHPRGDSRYVLSNSKDQSCKLWDLRCPTGPNGLEATRRAVAKQGWDYRWQRVPHRALTSPPLPGDTSLMTYRGHVVLNTLLRCRLAPPPGPGAGQYLSAACATGAVIVYDVLTGRPVRRLTNHSGCVRDVSWHPEGGALASASWDGSIRLWTYQEPDQEPMGEQRGRDPP
ncbi:DDB1- and CUL4-associated factor 11-like [Melopsittacus undulatus]|uniref:DDB1- and CUL4-associated factor 11-like n=1 Tax=Melopsittacus undulatus TaxID=13146 RepID=UPI00146A044F|nr:DDB1- and CUL4-associated factor 11-like [Melopsittacus undulatus]